jgi:P-type Mg2+ transporter
LILCITTYYVTKYIASKENPRRCKKGTEIGPISSLFDYTTFALVWFVFHASAPEHQPLFRFGWFVEGLLSQTLIIHMIRTAKLPFIQSRAAPPLLLLTATIMTAGIYIPFSPLASYLGMSSLPMVYFFWLAVTLLGYRALTGWMTSLTP